MVEINRMRKGLKLIKKVIALFLVFIFCIESFAAIVSDNDGSAFLTKAEFEAMKKDFDTQINQYNRSLDNKIDGAIAAYLAGIRMSEPPENLYEKIKNAIGQDLVFLKGTKTTTNSLNNEISINCINRFYVKTNVSPDLDYECWRSIGTNPNTGNPGYRPMLVRVIPNAEGYYGASSSYNFEECVDRPWALGAAGDGWFDVSEATGGRVPGADVDFTRTSEEQTRSYGGSIYMNATYNPMVKYKNSNVQTISADGSGQCYTFTMASGNRCLDEYASSYWPMLRGSATWHSYANYYAQTIANWRAWHETDNGMKITTVQTANTGRASGWGTQSWGTSVGEESETSGYWGSVTYALCKNTDGVDYGVMQWGNGTNVDIYACSTDQAVTIASAKTTFTFNNSTYERDMYQLVDLTKVTQTNDLPANKLEYYLPSITPVSYKLNTFTNSYLSAIAGETVYLGGGMPIVRTTDSDQRLRIKFTANTTGPSANKVKVVISDKQFVDGNLAPGAHEFYSNECTPGTSYETTIDIVNKNQVVWMNIYDTNTTNNYNASLEEFRLQVA